MPPARIEEFLDSILPSQADKLVASGDEASLREALAQDPRHTTAAVALGRLLVARGERDEARSVLADQQRANRSSARVGRPPVQIHRCRNHAEWPVALERMGLAAKHRDVPRPRIIDDALHQTGLADAGLPLDRQG